MLHSYFDSTTEKIHVNGKFPRKFPRELRVRTLFLLDLMDALESLETLQKEGHPPTLRLHKLQGDRLGYLAIDINKVSGWRITFLFEDGVFKNVRVENYHS